MGEQFWWHIETCLLSLGDGLAEMDAVPVDDDGGEQIETGHAIVLSLHRPVSDFALTSDAQGVFESMVRLALVETDTGAALHVDIEDPVDEEERAFDPADFPERQR
jgi:hypothetical protein